MAGAQFFRCKTYKRVQGRSGFVLAEFARVPWASGHVADPQRPILLHGMAPADLPAQLEARIAAAVEVTKTGKKRRIRSTLHVLMGAIFSFPALISELQADPALFERLAQWRELTIAWAKRQWGEQIWCIVQHVDENRPHLHVVAVSDDASLRAKLLHPGWVAKERVLKERLAAGASYREALHSADIAYRRAMRAILDDYHTHVGQPCHLSRLIKARKHLPRHEHQALRAEHRARDEAIRDRDQAIRDRDLLIADAYQMGLWQAEDEAKAIRQRARQSAASIVDKADETACAAIKKASRTAERMVAQAEAARDSVQAETRVLRQERDRAREAAAVRLTPYQALGERVAALGTGLSGHTQRAVERAVEAVEVPLRSKLAEQEAGERELRRTIAELQTRLRASERGVIAYRARAEQAEADLVALRHDREGPGPELQPKLAPGSYG
ncbi:hypothetical protein [Methylobacterium oxalidis]|uniref:Plasmid recombination enzyme n=1 Tax=Methylobacterium oxalidis TaxID=944322 RepID=A0A512JB52_9HYPH|nr:hypothetical protein [Methylobacterium oxalidis]GEP07198.1 hypothetical protein MOX02_52360 [Methylobacterium oxalidis]GJE31493.1 hypothetical protein LDDCCGHA_1672 [Methylobacterium oxalidis]GLS65790.1 hypothetical protein GCM10007888_41720 [Methylobacterium oxalidis]